MLYSKNWYIGPQSFNYYLNSEDIRELRDYYRSIARMPGVHVIDSGARFCMYYSEKTGQIELVSFWTHVASGTAGKIFRRWSDYSRTTAEHVKMLAEYCGAHAPNKKEWLAMPVIE